jgi:hypothetical protein
MYRAISSFILSPNKHCSNIFTSIFRAIKPQGLARHLQTTATRSLHQTINVTASNKLKNCDVKGKKETEVKIRLFGVTRVKFSIPQSHALNDTVSQPTANRQAINFPRHRMYMWRRKTN